MVSNHPDERRRDCYVLFLSSQRNCLVTDRGMQIDLGILEFQLSNHYPAVISMLQLQQHLLLSFGFPNIMPPILPAAGTFY